MAFDLGSVIAYIKADISDFSSGMKKAEKEAGGLKTVISDIGSTISSFGKQAALFTGVVSAGFGVFLSDASTQAKEFEKAMISLDIIAGRFGVSGQQAQKSAKNLGDELRIGTSAAAEGLQNLLKSGLNLDQATDLMKRFTNEAMTGKSANITLADAVKNLSFAYATQNSALGNMSGVSENFEDIIKKGRESLIKQGKAVKDITDDMAKYQGMIELTNLTMGSSERFTGNLIDKEAEFELQMVNLKIAVGQAFNPIKALFIDTLSNSGVISGLQQTANYVGMIAQAMMDWDPIRMQESFSPETIELLTSVHNAFLSFLIFVKDNQEILTIFLQGMAIGFGALLVVGTIAGLLTLLLNPLTLAVIAIGALYTAWQTNFMGIQTVTQTVFDFIVNLVNTYLIPTFLMFTTWLNEVFFPAFNMVFNGLIVPLFNSFVGWFKDRWDYIILIISGTWQIISGIITIAWNYISGYITAGLQLISGDWRGAHETIQNISRKNWEAIKGIFNGIIDFVRGWGGTVFNGLVEPFQKAWDKVRELADKIKGAMDPNQRHSPSLVDRVNKGVHDLNAAWDGLQFGTQGMAGQMTATSQVGVAPVAAGVGGNNIIVDMSGAYISSEQAAREMGEKIGDQIIRKLQVNVRM